MILSRSSKVSCRINNEKSDIENKPYVEKTIKSLPALNYFVKSLNFQFAHDVSKDPFLRLKDCCTTQK